MGKEYILMNKDTEVLHFKSEKNEFGEVLFEQLDEEKAPLPIV